MPTIHQARFVKRGETWKAAAQRLAAELDAANCDGTRIRVATVIEIFNERLNLHYDQRAYSWHEIQYALDAIRELARAESKPSRD